MDVSAECMDRVVCACMVVRQPEKDEAFFGFGFGEGVGWGGRWLIHLNPTHCFSHNVRVA